MKMRKLFSFLLVLLMALAAALPAKAVEGPVQVQDPATTPEEAPTEDVPGWLLPSEDGEQTPDTTADPAAPEMPENPEVPEETPPSAEPEIPENPEIPDTPEVPENPGQPIDPENPETPEIPETPAPDVNAPGPEDPAPLPESPIAEEAPIIEVLVPNSGQIIINPYGLPVELEGQTATDQIVSAPLILQNLSTVPVSVSASVTGTVPPGSGVSFANVPPMPDSPVKEIFLFAEFQPVPESAFQPAWSGMFSDSTNQLLVGFQSTAKTDILRLEASGAAYSFGAMRLFGSAAVSPMTPWQAGDDIQATFVFSFAPITEAMASDLPDPEQILTEQVLPEQMSPEQTAPAQPVPEETVPSWIIGPQEMTDIPIPTDPIF